ncbi:MAG TPA: sugar ABC transporter permease [Lachnospiraceae bacterium]|nr:sugar ABC transporter permease [Lachnospiraceae bacterium]
MTYGKNPSSKKRRILSNESKWGYLFILLPLCTFTLFTLYPLFDAFIISFQKFKPLKTEWVGFNNYITAFKNSLFYKSIINTIVYTVLTIPLSMMLSFVISILIVPLSKRKQNFFKAAYYLPAIASGVALSFVWKWIYDPLPTGLLNRIVHFFGVENQNWLGSSKTSMLSLVLMALLSSHGTSIIIYIAALLGIDNTYFESADIDGATFFQKLHYIVLPLVKPTTVFLLITGVIGSFQVFQNAYLMTGGGPDNSTTMVGLLIFNNAFTYFDYGQACAQALVLTAIIALFTFIQFKVTGDGVEY